MTHVPFHCARCGLAYGQNFISIEGDVRLTLQDNRATCPGCGFINGMALPDGTYDVRNGRFHLVRRVAESVVGVGATRDDFEHLVGLLKTWNEYVDGTDIADRVEAETPFAALARILKENPPGWTAYLISIVLAVLLWVVPPPSEWADDDAPAKAPINTTELSPQQLDELVRRVAEAVKPPDIPEVEGRRPGRAPARNHACPCGSAKKYKRCCADVRAPSSTN